MKEQPVRFFDRYSNWDAAENDWDVRADRLKESNQLKQLKKLPNLPGIRKNTRTNLRWKALKYLLIHDEKNVFPIQFRNMNEYGPLPFALLSSLNNNNHRNRGRD